MGLPILKHRPPHYRGSRLKPFAINVSVNGIAFDMTGGKAMCQLKNKKTGNTIFTFPETGENALTILGTRIIFPNIKSWVLEAGIWEYDVRVELLDQTVLFFTNGNWEVIQNVTDKSNG